MTTNWKWAAGVTGAVIAALALAAAAFAGVGGGSATAKAGGEMPEEGVIEPALFPFGRGSGDFLPKLAENLGITEDELTAAIRQTHLDIIDQAEADGELSAEEADCLRENLDSEEPFLFGPGKFCIEPPAWAEFGAGEGGLSFAFGVATESGEVVNIEFTSDDIAEFLGITSEELAEEVGVDSTLAEVAEAHGKSRQELIDFLSASLDEQLAAAVAAGTIDQAEADDFSEKVLSQIESFIDGQFAGPPCLEGAPGTLRGRFGRLERVGGSGGVLEALECPQGETDEDSGPSKDSTDEGAESDGEDVTA
ncbi:MAG: hypothetical protein WEB00_01895 [Dehalococcoidia bacterium]